MRATAVPQEVWDAYAAYLQHVASDRRPCRVCIAADKPSAGCVTGIKLYGAYKLTTLAAQAQ